MRGGGGRGGVDPIHNGSDGDEKERNEWERREKMKGENARRKGRRNGEAAVSGEREVAGRGGGR